MAEGVFPERELLRLIFCILYLLLDELFLRPARRNQFDRQLIELPVNRNGGW
jgi:hypothetical protein